VQNYNQNNSPKVHWGIIFWVVFIVFIIGLFLFNWDRIQENLSHTEMPSRFLHVFLEKKSEASEAIDSSDGIISPLPVIPETGQETTPDPNELTEDTEPVITHETAPQSVNSAPPSANAVTRTVYFIKVDQQGDLQWVALKRALPNTNSPMTDALNSLIAGISSDEQQPGLISLIPEGTRIISAAIQQGTAYISFSEEFLYNRYGIEGYAGQIRQIVWTATEFPTVNNVQILVEGRKVSYLGDSIWIGDPISRENFSRF
jgi:spore germination protein GerM